VLINYYKTLSLETNLLKL